MPIQLRDIVFVDFEASALRDSYPIEVGWACADGSHIDAGALLILPADEWVTPAYTWDPLAEAVHGLSQARLMSEGMAPSGVCHALNQQFPDKIVVFDTGPDGVDRHWLDMLFSEGGQARAFKLGGPAGDLLQALAAENAVTEAVQAKIRAMAPPINHRAAQDAVHYAWRAAAIDLIAHSMAEDNIDRIARQISVRGIFRR